MESSTEAHRDRNRSFLIAGVMILVGALCMGWASSAASSGDAESNVGGLGALIAVLSAIPMRHLGWWLLGYIPVAYVVALVLSFALLPLF